MAGRLTTHVLDTSRGRPAAGVAVEVLRDGAAVASSRTNADGRTDAPLCDGDAFTPGVYEIRFDVGAYFGDAGSFLEVVPVRFTVTDASRHHHVPLLVAPFGYSTYRGS